MVNNKIYKWVNNNIRLIMYNLNADRNIFGEKTTNRIWAGKRVVGRAAWHKCKTVRDWYMIIGLVRPVHNSSQESFRA